METVGSPLIWDVCRLYHTEMPCGVLVALGFLLPARSFTPKGISKTWHRTEKLLILGFALCGAATGPVAPIGCGLVEEKITSPSSSEAERPFDLGLRGEDLTPGLKTVGM